MSTYAISGPASVMKIYHEALGKMIEQGKPRDTAERYALRCVHNAGWYRASTGWKRLHPDVRNRVQIREAVKQPDGRYLIEDVDVFYPNAVKKDKDGSPIYHTADDIRRYIANTNRAISRGARTALVKGHPDPLINKTLDKQTPSYGAPVRFRENPGRIGWAKCDLTDVDPELVEEMKQRRYPGLSAGFAEDAGGLATRFGHVAVLGAESQALMNLPTLDVYSSSNQLCFSASTPTPHRRIHMDKTKAKEMAECYASYGAAFASIASGEPDGEHKLAEHLAKYGAKMKEYSAGDAFNADVTGETPSLPGGAFSEEEGKGSEETELAESPLSDEGGATPNKSEFAAAIAENTRLRKQNLEAIKKMQALTGQLVRGQYEKKRDELLAAGHQFDAEEADGMFAACADNKNPGEALKRLFSFLSKTPKREMLSSIPGVFGADAANAPGRGKKADLSEKELGKVLDDMYNATGKTFSADDWNLGKAFDGMFSAEVAR